MDKMFTKDSGIKTDQVNFRVTSDEKMLLTLMCDNVGDFLRSRISTSTDTLKFCRQRRDQAKQKYEKFLSDLETMDYLDLVYEYEEEFQTKWDDLYDVIKAIFECKHERDEPGYLIDYPHIRQLLIGSVTEEMLQMYAYWDTQYTTTYVSVSNEKERIQQELSSLPKPDKED